MDTDRRGQQWSAAGRRPAASGPAVDTLAPTLKICSLGRHQGRQPKKRLFSGGYSLTDDTDDVFQNAALRLHRALAELRPSSPRDVMALAATQVRRELLDLARRHAGPLSPAARHATNLIPADDANLTAFQVDRAAAADEPGDRWSAFHEAIDRLPPERREVFHLVWYLGADQRTIARLLGCSTRTVKSRWQEARAAVREALDGRRPE